MSKINFEVFNKLLDINDDSIKNKIEYLIDYSDYIASLEDKISELNLNTKLGIYMAGQYDTTQRDKHGVAINTLFELNEYCKENKLGELYNGEFNDKNRGEIAQAIMDVCEDIFDNIKCDKLKL